tara:strand:- start:109 stop:912 length:804 start_codon:yes stop_codon:yes gene_type:complete
MDGYGHNSNLPDSLRKKIPNAMIFNGKRDNEGSPNGGIGIWSPVEPGHGNMFQTDGVSNSLSKMFGPELSFAKKMTSDGVKIAIIKYSFGGTALYPGAGYGDWHPDQERINHLDNALSTINNAFDVADINGDGRLDRLIPSGIIWMQGESDAEHSKEASEAYYDNLKNLINLLRASLRNEKIPAIIGKINDSHMTSNGGPTQPFIKIVHSAQKNFTEEDDCASYVTEIESYNFSDDAWHYDTDGFIKMGIAFANAVEQLEDNCLETN